MTNKLDKLLEQLVNLHPKYIDLSLKRLSKLLSKLDNPHLKIPPVIHIAGTNGKGSTLSYIKNIMIINKMKVHTYTSPHLKLFNERITISNKQIQTKLLFNTLKYIKEINKNEPITFFEITTAAAFYLFSKHKADFLILETGLGGRLDATNIITNSLISIITKISLDHQDYLGKSIYKITNEKLGIIKKDNIIIISKQKNLVINHIKNKLKKKNNEKIYYNTNFKIKKINNKKFTLKFRNKVIEYTNPKLIGNHQIENASNAITTILKLNEIGYKFKKNIINKGILQTSWPGRLEVGKLKKIKVYLDGAHNVDGAEQILKYFKNQNIKFWLIFGMLNNKDINIFLKKLKPVIEGIVAIPIPGEKNCFTVKEISEVCKKLKIKHCCYNNISEANKYLLKKINPEVILVSGSLYLVGKVREKYL
jgi:dihydrofolate synthase / folylpolyglutamate synthase